MPNRIRRGGGAYKIRLGVPPLTFDDLDPYSPSPISIIPPLYIHIQVYPCLPFPNPDITSTLKYPSNVSAPLNLLRSPCSCLSVPHPPVRKDLASQGPDHPLLPLTSQMYITYLCKVVCNALGISPRQSEYD
ncbi:hypothetical protein N7495_009221 [Penicillium taxi]|uniref:uncharacterized protein n=1 Tax=Penicillium taxi TaxID=168475 RepID=UPI0025458AA4|nr:uncharacterized protein N7495_009221 [Penicillium taxi]KAJ5884711.1 hypothetical protein N7495_009221 [Penicillium taxi]